MKYLLISLVSMFACAGSQAPVVTAAQKEACNQKGLTVINAGTNCEQIVSDLDHLIYVDPICKPFFEHSLSGTNCKFLVKQGASK